VVVASKRPVLLILALLISVFAGCLGSDDDPETDVEDLGDEEGLGSVAGQVYNLDGLAPIRGATVRLVDSDSEVAGNASTGENGGFVIRNVEPGTYRLQASAACCRESVSAVTVEADTRSWVNFTLERYAQLRVETPFIDPDGEWEGFISCAIAAQDQNPMFPGPCLADENHNHRRIVFFPPGVRTITMHIEWEPAGGGLGAEEMAFSISNLNAGLMEIGRVEGTSPLQLQIQNLDFEDPDDRLSAFDEDGWVARLQMQPLSSAADVVFQQSFSVYYHVHYWQAAEPSYTVMDNFGSGSGGAETPTDHGLPGWISPDIRGLIEMQAEEGQGPNPYQEGENGDCLDYQGLYLLDGQHSPLAAIVQVEGGSGYVTDSSAGSAHVDFFDSEGNWLAFNAGNPNGNAPQNAEYGVMCVGLTSSYPDVPEPFALWFYMDGFSRF
jgi:hypothetical protein